MKMSKWIEFKLKRKCDKTDVYSVVSRISHLELGEIKWSCAWRQYAFFPIGFTLYEETCLRDIADFLILLRRKRVTVKPANRSTLVIGDKVIGEI